jgi:hypothetical protein
MALLGLNRDARFSPYYSSMSWNNLFVIARTFVTFTFMACPRTSKKNTKAMNLGDNGSVVEVAPSYTYFVMFSMGPLECLCYGERETLERHSFELCFQDVKKKLHHFVRTLLSSASKMLRKNYITLSVLLLVYGYEI